MSRYLYTPLVAHKLQDTIHPRIKEVLFSRAINEVIKRESHALSTEIRGGVKFDGRQEYSLD